MQEKNYLKNKKQEKPKQVSFRTVPENERLLHRLQREANEFRELMADFNPNCSVKYGPRVIQQMFREIKYHTDSDEGYGKKWGARDYKGAIKDVKYAIDCLNFLSEIAAEETMQYLVPQLKPEESHQAYEKIQNYLDSQVKELELIIDQIHLDMETESKKGSS